MGDPICKRPSEWTPEDMAEVIRNLEDGKYQLIESRPMPSGISSGSMSSRYIPSFNPCGEIGLASGSLGGRRI